MTKHQKPQNLRYLVHWNHVYLDNLVLSINITKKYYLITFICDVFSTDLRVHHKSWINSQLIYFNQVYSEIYNSYSVFYVGVYVLIMIIQ